MAPRMLSLTDHRPWPLPRAPWLMRQTWRDLLFAHWPFPPDALRALVPAVLALDLYDGRAWLGVVPFRITGLRPRAIPAFPLYSRFPELNVRTYVTLRGKPGVYFFSLDAGRVLPVLGARALFHLPYFIADMEVRHEGDAVHYRSRRRAGAAAGASPPELVARYAPTAPPYPATPGSLDHFLTERYCLYAVSRHGRAFRVDLHHAPWPLQPAQAVFEVNTMTRWLGLELPPAPPLLYFARRLDVVNWGPMPVEG